VKGVNVYTFKDIDIREVSAFIMEVKKTSGQWREETTLDNVENSMNRGFADTNDLLILSRDVASENLLIRPGPR
jgi:hypothetical protein